MSLKAVVAYNGADAGLGNRMRVTLGAHNLAVAESRALFYVWPRTPAFEPALTDLWDWSGGIRVSRAVSRAMAKVTGYLDNDLRDVRSRQSQRVWQIRTGGVLQLPPGVPSWYKTLRTLTPAAPVADTIRAFFDANLRGRPYVGVQIRAHQVSHQATKDASPVSWYVERMRQLRVDQPGIGFFVSCDVLAVKREIVEQFPGSAALFHDAAYNSVPAVQSAVADLYLLASSSGMIGPHYSSFIEMAEYLTHPLVHTEKATEQPRLTDWQSVPLTTDPLTPRQR